MGLDLREIGMGGYIRLIEEIASLTWFLGGQC